MKLYSYFRSSASFRVRIALALKGLDYDYVAVHLLKDGGQQFSAEFKSLNPATLVPVVEDDGTVLTQSLAIIEYLDETRPQVPLLPSDAAGRARVRAIALTIACEIHPLNNLRVLSYLSKPLSISDEQKNVWYCHWVETGLASVESMLSGNIFTGTYCHGESPSLADICLIPQIFNAQRFKANLSHVPTVMRIHDACMRLPAFADSAPLNQPDAE